VTEEGRQGPWPPPKFLKKKNSGGGGGIGPIAAALLVALAVVFQGMVVLVLWVPLVLVRLGGRRN
jgi:hypothetical protein